jgi:hypothetical protein
MKRNELTQAVRVADERQRRVKGRSFCGAGSGNEFDARDPW